MEAASSPQTTCINRESEFAIGAPHPQDPQVPWLGFYPKTQGRRGSLVTSDAPHPKAPKVRQLDPFNAGTQQKRPLIPCTTANFGVGAIFYLGINKGN